MCETDFPPFQMHSCIYVRGCVSQSVRPSVRSSVRPSLNHELKYIKSAVFLAKNRDSHWAKTGMYRVILKKVSFDIFTMMLVSKEEKKFTTKSEDKGQSLSKFSGYLVIVKII